MDNKKSFARFWHVAVAFVLVVLIIIASVGSISFGLQGEHIYTVAGIINFGWLYPVIRQAIKYINDNE